MYKSRSTYNFKSWKKGIKTCTRNIWKLQSNKRKENYFVKNKQKKFKNTKGLPKGIKNKLRDLGRWLVSLTKKIILHKLIQAFKTPKMSHWIRLCLIPNKGIPRIHTAMQNWISRNHKWTFRKYGIEWTRSHTSIPKQQ